MKLLAIPAFRCFLIGHDWTPWRHWARRAPRIVRASMEYLNDSTHSRDCQRCGAHESRKKHEIPRAEWPKELP
jgi:hypothetical protein